MGVGLISPTPENNLTNRIAIMNVLVIGGAGYIGSHCVRQLIAAGHKPVVLDNLVYGHKGALLPSVKF